MRRAMPLIYLGREETRREHLGGSTIFRRAEQEQRDRRRSVRSRSTRQLRALIGTMKAMWPPGDPSAASASHTAGR
jgi:hypothetical protein